MNPKPADLMFTFSKGNLISEAIAYFSHAKISHVECIMDTGISGTLEVMSAEEGGLVPRWVIPETLDWYSILTCPTLTLKQRDTICSWMWNHKDTPYDFFGLASFPINVDENNEAKLFCSEACFLAYKDAEMELLTGIDHAFVTPRDLWISPMLVTLDGSKKEVR